MLRSKGRVLNPFATSSGALFESTYGSRCSLVTVRSVQDAIVGAENGARLDLELMELLDAFQVQRAAEHGI
ncbi:hypothetical protein Tdes44962_MAKER02109 [Teratosphaeria destructans]|uniref:Uncharacterized protein n=1 Tax=Teratosphaeria destructans TaxID=418781 RepID=A0A9W7W3U3_9PEZI|nr:hypothetical protein Tdes44962_MAKER02109 [Teratosphaeria destructans]